jgi:hypothetical protein
MAGTSPAMTSGVWFNMTGTRSSPNFTLLRAKRLILLWWHDLCSHNILQIDIDMIGAQ